MGFVLPRDLKELLTRLNISSEWNRFYSQDVRDFISWQSHFCWCGAKVEMPGVTCLVLLCFNVDGSCFTIKFGYNEYLTKQLHTIIKMHATGLS